MSTFKAVVGIESFDLQALPHVLRAAPPLSEVLQVLNRLPGPVV